MTAIFAPAGASIVKKGAMDQIEVLIIDEHAAVCHALASRLSAVTSIRVVGATCDLGEGLCLAEMSRPDIILLELKWSDRIGNRRTFQDPDRAISKLLKAGGCSIIVLTSYLDEAEKDSAIAAGAKRYLLKDIDTGRLVTEIEDVISETLSI